MSYAMDLTPLIVEPDKVISEFVQDFIARFARDVAGRIDRLS
jgi:hypothetical protein